MKHPVFADILKLLITKCYYIFISINAEQIKARFFNEILRKQRPQNYNNKNS